MRESELFFLRFFLRCACRRGLSAGAGLVPQAGAVFFYLTEVFRSRKSEMFFCGGFSRCACRRSLPAGAGLAPRAGAGFFYLTEVFRSRESEMFFCGIFRDVRADAACLLARACSSCRGGFFYLTEVFCSRESELFFLQVFSRCACRRSLPAGAGLPLRPGRALPFLTKRKEAKIRQGGSFDSLPLGTPTQRPKALPLETERSSRSGSYSRTGTACA